MNDQDTDNYSEHTIEKYAPETVEQENHLSVDDIGLMNSKERRVLRYMVPSELAVNKEASVELLKKVDRKNPETIWNFIIANMPFITFIIMNKFHKINDEMMSDGVMGMYKALNRYNNKFPHGTFLSYAGMVIGTSVRIGICKRSSQIDPTYRLMRSVKKHVFELSLNEEKTDQESNGELSHIPLREIVSDPLCLNPSVIVEDLDSAEFLKKLLDHCKKDLFFKNNISLLKLISECHPGDPIVIPISKKTNLSKQCISKKIKVLIKRVNKMLSKTPSIKKEFNMVLGKKYREFLQTKASNRKNNQKNLKSE